jgi:hypothetical protein
MREFKKVLIVDFIVLPSSQDENPPALPTSKPATSPKQ